MVRQKQERERGRKKKSHKKILLYTAIAVLSIATPVLGSLFLLNMDRYHDCFQRFVIRNFIGQKNYYGGEAWFSATATLIGGLISAVPGLMCGILALLQTQRLHKLEARYHRPSLKVKNARFYCAYLEHFQEEVGGSWNGLEIWQYAGTQEALNQPFPWWLHLTVDLSLVNEMSVQHIDIESVTVSFPKAVPPKEYIITLSKSFFDSVAIRSLKRTIENEQAVYVLSYCLNPFILKPSAVGKERNDDLDECLHQFAFWHDGHNPGFPQMELTVAMNLKYDYLDEKTEKCLLRIIFESTAQDKILGRAASASAFGKNPNIVTIPSTDGYITYEV